MARSPITDVVKAFNTLTMDEQRIFLDLVDPQPDEEEEQPEKPKRKRKKTGKTPRASSIQQAIAGTGKPAPVLCAHVSDNGDDPTTCHELQGNGVHDKNLGYVDYHEFQAPLASAAGGN